MDVLLVDDEPLELEQLVYLIKPNYPVWRLHPAEDAVQALRLAEETVFPLAFVDIQLPGQSGLALTARLKERNPSTEIIITTAYQDFSYAKRAIQLDVMAYLVKPIVESELKEAIGRYLHKHPLSTVKSTLIEKVLAWVDRHYQEKISLGEAAKKFHVHPTYLSRRFSDEMGISFKEYVLQYRIEQAKSLLIRHPAWNMARVAETVGFSSQQHFSNAFRKYARVTPTEYREKHG